MSRPAIDRPLLAQVEGVVTRAMARARAARPAHADRKAHQDFVTDIDMAIDRLLEADLGALLPGIPVLSEERAVDHTGDFPLYWIVDPIDGTLNMMRGIPFFAVAVALVDATGPCLAVVGAVAQDSVTSALRGSGAWQDGAALRVPDTAPDMIVLSTGLMDLMMRQGDVAAWRALRGIGKIRNLGAQALHIGGVAQGRFAAVASLEARVWDEAAGGLILREAGGAWQSAADGCDWRRPADLMALREQRSVAAHPAVAQDVQTILAPVFDAAP